MSRAGPSPAHRLAAAAALLAGATALVVAAVGIHGDLLRVVGVVLALALAVAAAWIAATRAGTTRLLAAAAAAGALALALAVTLSADAHGLSVVAVAALIAASTALSHTALARDDAHADDDRVVVPAARHGVLVMNLRSGGGKAERFGLEEECRRRGIEPVVLRPGDDLLVLAQDAVARGADVIGMAGGDGSQALVASVAMTHDVPLVCVPAGTRNHFALDLGLDRDDVVGALDAFGEAVERRIDLATVGDRVFVNNVSLGIYAEIVQSDAYRDAKGRTVAMLLPELLGPGSEPVGLRFPGPDGEPREGVHVLQVSNNPYVLARRAGFGSRERLDTGQLGIATIKIGGGERGAGRLSEWAEWTAPTFTVGSEEAIAAGVDGEALELEPPLEFRVLPRALRVRIPVTAPGRSPAAAATRGGTSPWWTFGALARTALGRSPD